MTEPGVVADRDLVAAPPFEQLGLVLGILPIIGSAIGEVMKRRPFDERLRRARRKERFNRVIAQLQLT